MVQAGADQTFVVASPLYFVEISNRGGVVKTWKLKKYMDDQQPPQPLDLVNESVAQQLGWPFSVVLSDPALQASANSGLYQIETHSVPTAAAPTGKTKTVTTAVAVEAPASEAVAPTEVDMHWSDGHLEVTKKIKFDLNYEVNVDVVATLDGKALPVAIAHPASHTGRRTAITTFCSATRSPSRPGTAVTGP